MKVSKSCAISFLVALFLLATIPAEAQDWSCTNCIAGLSAGGDHACATRQDGSLTCWGRDLYGQATPPDLDPDMYAFLEVATGDDHTCARVQCTPPPGGFCPIGNIRCWGDDDFDQASPAFGAVYDSIAAGNIHTCGLTATNDIECWGNDSFGQSTVPEPPNGWQYTEVSVGGFHTCALTECVSPPCLILSNIRCWGDNGAGQTDVPGTFPLYPTFAQISAGEHHTCGVKTDGTVLCWGFDSNGQSTPPGGTFQQVSSGFSHTCGLKTDGTIECWGYDGFGLTTPPSGTFLEVSSGMGFACAVRSDRSVACWGSDSYNRTLPTAGRCGLFDADFEAGGDCRWSNGSVLCWTADCDGDGYVSGRSQTVCSATMPGGPPPECPPGTWAQQTATCAAFDCIDDNPDVFSGQTQTFSTGYGLTGQPADRFDFDCDGIEEKAFTNLASNVCCGWSGESCIAASLPGCDAPGWDAATVSEVPGCGEIAKFRGCAATSPSVCEEVIALTDQPCR